MSPVSALKSSLQLELRLRGSNDKIIIVTKHASLSRDAYFDDGGPIRGPRRLRAAHTPPAEQVRT